MPKTYEKNLVKQLGFSPKENAVGIYNKVYADGFIIEVDFDAQAINYGKDIKCESKTSQNFSQPENFVVLECVDRLLEKGYLPQDIVLEKTFPAGRGHSGRLDIFVKKEKKAFLMIECKTYGKEFEKELKNIEKNGGQLFTYFQQDTEAEFLMLYASKMTGDKIFFEHRIIKIEEEYRQASNVEKLFKLWDKSLCEQGLWENVPYDFREEIFTKSKLETLTEDEGKKLFHGFATILRKHSVSDKPNAFNVIFNLFLAKLWDEHRGEDDELEFQWKRKDDPVDFQVRLHTLHKDGLNDFLKKEVEGIDDTYFVANLTSEQIKAAKKSWLKFNKFFSIKDVLDDETFEQNHRVLIEVVKLIQRYRIRYPRKQEYLSEFFELLLTTGLKQEAGQYFTPVPVTKFIIKSLPIQAMIEQEINNKTAKLPAAIDYAAGSGHFITEIMEEYQNIIDNLDIEKFTTPDAKRKAKSWSKDGDPYSWASSYVYGIEKDYRLVKVAKVGCYFYGDGVAQVIHGDGLDSLTNPPKSYVGFLGENTNIKDSAKTKFSIVVANPPYSVKYCKEDLEYIGSEKEFTLYQYLTENSNEIECLFVERTKQLLKDGGVAGIILPSSILSNEGIYTKAREIILQHFEIIAVTELGSNTFMATGTNTIVLFLRRRSNLYSIKLKEFIDNFFVDFQDNNPPKPFNAENLEKPIAKYVNHVWQSVNLNDYVSIFNNKPTEKIRAHGFYKAYRKQVDTSIALEVEKAKNSRKNYSEEDLQKIKNNIEKKHLDRFRETEKEKILYFILAYNQTVVLVKTGGGSDEKRFLGYEFSNRKGHEGIRAVKGKDIDGCTKLYNLKNSEDATKASAYIYKAFSGDTETAIHESLKNNVSRARLVDMLDFDRPAFAKSISTNVKKKIKIESKWEQILLANAIRSIYGSTEKIEKFNIKDAGKYPVVTQEKDKLITGYSDNKNPITDIPIIVFGDHSCTLKYIDFNFFRGADGTVLLKPQDCFNLKYFYYVMQYGLLDLIENKENYERHYKYLQQLYIPLPPKEIQEKIVAEIEALENEELVAKEKVEKLIKNIDIVLETKSKKNHKIGDILTLEYGVALPEKNRINGEFPVMGSNGIVGYHNEYLIKSPSVIIGRKGSVGKVTWVEKNNFPIDTTFYVKLINDQFNLKLIYYSLKKLNLEKLSGGTGVPGVNRNGIYAKTISLPSLSEQQKIVSEIGKIEAEIQDMQRKVDILSNQKGMILEKYL